MNHPANALYHALLRMAPRPRLVTPYGRYSRAAVIERAQQIHAEGRSWAEAMQQAHREAAAELRAYYARRRP